MTLFACKKLSVVLVSEFRVRVLENSGMQRKSPGRVKVMVEHNIESI